MLITIRSFARIQWVLRRRFDSYLFLMRLFELSRVRSGSGKDKWSVIGESDSIDWHHAKNQSRCSVEWSFTC